MRSPIISKPTNTRSLVGGVDQFFSEFDASSTTCLEIANLCVNAISHDELARLSIALFRDSKIHTLTFDECGFELANVETIRTFFCELRNSKVHTLKIVSDLTAMWDDLRITTFFSAIKNSKVSALELGGDGYFAYFAAYYNQDGSENIRGRVFFDGLRDSNVTKLILRNDEDSMLETDDEDGIDEEEAIDDGVSRAELLLNIVRSLQRCTKITSLTLDTELNNWTPQEINAFSEALTGTNITTLDLRSADPEALAVSPEQAIRFAQALQNSKIKTLGLTCNQLFYWNDESMDNFFRELQAAKINSLNLSENYKGEGGVLRFNRAFFANLGASQLTSLTFSRNMLACWTQSLITDFFHALRASQITVLNLSHNDFFILKPEGITAFFSQFRGSKVTSLDLSDNDLHTWSPEQVTVFFTALEGSKITSLILSNNNLSFWSSEQIIAFAEGMSQSAMNFCHFGNSIDALKEHLILLEKKMEEVALRGKQADGAGASDNITFSVDPLLLGKSLLELLSYCPEKECTVPELERITSSFYVSYLQLLSAFGPEMMVENEARILDAINAITTIPDDARSLSILMQLQCFPNAVMAKRLFYKLVAKLEFRENSDTHKFCAHIFYDSVSTVDLPSIANIKNAALTAVATLEYIPRGISTGYTSFVSEIERRNKRMREFASEDETQESEGTQERESKRQRTGDLTLAIVSSTRG